MPVPTPNLNCPGCGAPPGEDHGHGCPSTGVYLPEPETTFNHTHSAEEWDSYKTANGAYEVATQYVDGKFVCLYIKNAPKGRGLPDTLKFTDQADIQELLTALHAAVAGIHKRKDQPHV